MSRTKQRSAPNQERLKEAVYGDAPKVDRDAGVIRGVKILGRVSRNGREYSDQAMADAARLYEGRKVNVDHPTKGQAERGFLDGFGELRNVTRDGDGVWGDLHFLKTHHAAETVCESAERFPRQFGLSHDADGKVARRGGKAIVESVDVVHSVDIVGQPATNGGLFESVNETGKDRTVKTCLRELVESAGNSLFTARLKEMDAGMVDAHVEMESSEGASAEEQMAGAFRSMVIAVLDDKSLDVAGKTAKIKKILQTEDGLLNGKTPEGDKPADAGVAESLKTIVSDSLKPITESLAAGQLRGQCRELLESSGVQVTTERLDALVKAADESARKRLVESWPTAPAASSAKPVVRPAIQPPKEGERINFKAGLDRN